MITRTYLQALSRCPQYPYDLSPVEIDAIRQTKATLAIEQLQLNEEGLSEIESLVKGDISREEFQRKLKEKYQTHEEC